MEVFPFLLQSHLILGNKSRVKEIRDLVSNNPFKINDNIIKEKDCEKYLGDYLHNGGSSESVYQTVNKMYWRTISAILEIKSVIEDFRSCFSRMTKSLCTFVCS